MQLLTTLTCLLTEDRVRERLLAARTGRGDVRAEC
jgi:2-O-A-mannosyl-D-glycerate-specific PTS system IIC component